tara:strand:- start:205 stop:354 length:150 start_codon:yes stop_codon:yes gene_type:complete
MPNLNKDELEEIGEEVGESINKCIKKWSFKKTILVISTPISIYILYLLI